MNQIWTLALSTAAEIGVLTTSLCDCLACAAAPAEDVEMTDEGAEEKKTGEFAR